MVIVACRPLLSRPGQRSFDNVRRLRVGVSAAAFAAFVLPPVSVVLGPEGLAGEGVRWTRMLVLGISPAEAFGCLCPERIAA
jgi:hypothetical protein